MLGNIQFKYVDSFLGEKRAGHDDALHTEHESESLEAESGLCFNTSHHDPFLCYCPPLSRVWVSVIGWMGAVTWTSTRV